MMILYIDSIYVTSTSLFDACISQEFMRYESSGDGLANIGMSKRHKQTANIALMRKERLHVMGMQRFLARFACGSLGFSCAAALAIFVLQGFNLWGFRLDVTSLHWLGATAVGATCGLSGIVYRATFNRP